MWCFPFNSYFLVFSENLEPFISDFRCLNLNLFSLIFQHDSYCLSLCIAFILCSRLVSNLLSLSVIVPIPCVFVFFHIHPFFYHIHAFFNLLCLCSSVSEAFFLSLSLLCCSRISSVSVDEINCLSVELIKLSAIVELCVVL